ncbi:unnamed protein product [Lactuca saligna]|uniref:Uncharacterized protein n=1 Tax=Lactuca saligna TaxID=75948 RepID=A0AA36E3X1_LACSI|nr:unnamed protein product [Lactuca saligna]
MDRMEITYRRHPSGDGVGEWRRWSVSGDVGEWQSSDGLFPPGFRLGSGPNQRRKQMGVVFGGDFQLRGGGISNPKGRMSGSGVRWHTAEAPMLCPSVLSGEIDERGAKKMADGGRGGIPTAATTLSDEVGVSDGWQSIVVDEFARFLLCFERIPARGRGCKRRTTMGWCWDDF